MACGSSPLAYIVSSTFLPVLALITLSSTNREQRGQLGRLHLDVGDLAQILAFAVGVEQAEEFARDPVGQPLGLVRHAVAVP